eukprot:gnl/MRDRNA2_/MRDRNA2_102549_c0_seq1.p1 gnl/MRDRNA2_/MRDRNA2_102549_c0~~gnl/MRDRNA2_/MRDRNA2_102549_c0_seq1.p1  ORF type:complete len:229 (-),score=46.14 gnl/MRDRNA2_/MRDRNA2_102549_c0_seq1:395-1081(-)
MHNIRMITLYTLLMQVGAQQGIDRLTKRAIVMPSFDYGDFEATTLAKMVTSAVKSPPSMLVPPVIAQTMPDLRVKPNVAFVIADAPKTKPATKLKPPPPPSAPKPAGLNPKGKNAKPGAKKEEAEMDYSIKPIPGKVNPIRKLETTPNSFKDLQKKDKFAKQLLDAYKKECFTKGCGGKNAFIERSNAQIVSIPAIQLVSLLVLAGVTFAVRKFRHRSCSLIEEPVAI